MKASDRIYFACNDRICRTYCCTGVNVEYLKIMSSYERKRLNGWGFGVLPWH